MQDTYSTQYEANISCPTLALTEWCDRSQDWPHNEYVRVIPDRDRGEMRLYRQVGDTPGGEFVRAVVPVRSFDTREVDRSGARDRGRDPRVWNLHADDAMTLITWVRAFDAAAGEDPRVSVYWTGDDGMKMTEGAEFKQEMLRFALERAGDGREAVSVTLNGMWRSETQQFAGY